MKMLTVLLFAFATFLHASPAEDRWMQLFPNLKSRNNDHQVSYAFFFKVRDIDVAVELGANVDREVLMQKRYSELIYQGVLSETRFTVSMRSRRGSATVELGCDENEFLRLLSMIAGHELFAIEPTPKSEFETRATLLDSYWIVLRRDIGSRHVSLEREAGSSIPVDHFVANIWDVVLKKMESLPESDQRRFVAVTEK